MVGDYALYTICLISEGYSMPIVTDHSDAIYSCSIVTLRFIDNPRSKQMSAPFGTVFKNNRTQSVRLPAETRFPDSVKKVSVRVLGKDRILSPAESSWDSFFLGDAQVSDDFMPERADQSQTPREPL